MNYWQHYKYSLLVFFISIFSQITNVVTAQEIDVYKYKSISFPVKLEGKWTLIDTTGKIIDDEIKFDSISQEVSPFKHFIYQNNKIGILNSTGTILIKPQYDTIFKFYSFIIAKSKQQFDFYHILDIDLKFSIQADKISFWHEFIVTELNNKKGLFNYKGEQLLKNEYDGFISHDYCIQILKDGKSGIYHQELNKIILPATYSEIKSWENTTLMAWNNKYWIYILENGFIFDPKKNGWMETCPNNFIKYRLENNSVELYQIGNYQKLDNHGYEDFFPLSNGDIVVRKNGKIGLCDRAFNLLIKCEFEHLEPFYANRYYKFKKNNFFGIISRNGRIIISSKYSNIKLLAEDHLTNNYFLIFNKGKVGITDTSGNQLLAPIYDYIIGISGGFIVDLNNKFGMYNYEGKEVLPIEYEDYYVGNKDYHQRREYAALIPNTYFLIKSKKWYIAQKNGLLSTKGFEDIEIYKGGVKAYNQDELTIFDFEENGKFIELYTYKNAAVAKVKDTLTLVKSRHFGYLRYSIFQNQLTGKWGIHKLKDTGYAVAPIFRRVFSTNYDKYLGEISGDTLNFNIGPLNFFATEYFRTLEVHTGQITGHPYLTAEIRMSSLDRSNSKDLIYLDTTGKFFFEKDFFAHKKSDELLLTNGYANSIRVYNKGGSYSLTKNKYHTRLSEFTALLNNSFNIRIADKKTLDYLIDPESGIEIINGTWHGFDCDDESLKKPFFTGKQSYFYLGNFRKIPTIFSDVKDKFGLINTEGIIILKSEFDSIKPLEFTDYGFYKLFNSDNKKSLHLISTDTVIHEIEQVTALNPDRLLVQKNGKQGLITTSGKTILNIEFSSITQLQNGIFVCTNESGMYIYSSSGEQVSKEAFQNIFPLYNGRMKVIRNGKYGYLDEDGHLVISCIYKKAEDFNSGFAIVKKEMEDILINQNGDELFIIAKEMDYMGSGIFQNKTKKGIQLYNANTKKNIDSKKIKRVDEIKENKILAKTEKGLGVLNFEGKWIIQDIYQTGEIITNGKIILYKSGLFYLFDSDAKLLLNIAADDYTLTNSGIEWKTDKGMVKSDYKGIINTEIILTNSPLVEEKNNQWFINQTNMGYTFINANKENINSKYYQNAMPFKSGYAAIKENNNWGIIDSTGKIQVKPNFYKILDYGNNWYLSVSKPKVGTCDLDGIILLDCKYDDVVPVNYTIFLVRKGNSFAYIYKDGTYLWPFTE